MTDLLVAPYLRCYRSGCWLDDTDVELALEMNLNAQRSDKHRTRTLGLQMWNMDSISPPAEEYSAQQTRDLLLFLQIGCRRTRVKVVNANLSANIPWHLFPYADYLQRIREVRSMRRRGIRGLSDRRLRCTAPEFGGCGLASTSSGCLSTTV
jgi:hypothetical protein